MSSEKKVLYITYDGMTDSLGQSQVLPYLIGLSRKGYEITILSFEKKQRFNKYRNIIEKITAEAKIEWVPISFTSKPPVVAKYYDMVRMKLKVFSLYNKNKYDLIHCRSYLAADLGLTIKRKEKAKFLFDMRGFWADEKKDGGSWNQDKLIFRKIYRYYKKKEAQFVHDADCIISLTESGKNEMMRWPSYNPQVPLKVIPCCADMDHFSLTSPAAKKAGRDILGISGDELVISYLGSIGSWYMLNEMLELFSVIKEKYIDSKFLFITHSSPGLIFSELEKYKISPHDIVVKEATRNEVPVFMKASDISVSFIKPVYSKLSSSPTKLGEVLSMGIPVIVNSGVGDVEEIIKQTEAGYVINSFNKNEYSKVAECLGMLTRISPSSIREKAEVIYSLKQGIEKYAECYSYLLENKEEK
ncbi:MAG: glycosyltransferase [Bacteroidetes bacterium]|nr:glycosyltransferase [Bacteroidota bacterium]